MAQNEIQKYSTDLALYQSVRNPLETFYNTFDKLEKLSNFLNSADAADYPGVPTDTITDMGTLRTAINTFLAATATTEFMTEVKNFVQA